ncbi:zinc finger protein 40-like [Xiphophorus maculatus]|uniref:zinc finger protein 40-like n=1 Tax=Xiphophorus maculatus TaxID=8083 RepID=UPI000C6EDFFF|nr:zinc finger protein 40-like [Xiphophorus maculatus]
MTVRITQSMEDEDCKRLCSAEVYSTPPYCIDHERVAKVQLPTDDIANSKTNEQKEKKRPKQEVNLCFRNKQPLEVRISERRTFLISHSSRSQTQPGVVCGECDRESPGESGNPTALPEESQTSVCKVCSGSLDAPVGLGEHLTPGEERRGHQDDTPGGESKDQAADRNQLRESDRQDAAHEDDDGTHDEGSGSAVADSSHTRGEIAGAEGRLLGNTCSSPPPTPSRKSSTSTRRALFARRCLNASSSGASHSPHTQSPDPGREPSPPRSPSPGPHPSPALTSPLSPSSRPVSSVLKTAVSPVRGPAEGSNSAGLPSSPAGGSAPCQTCRPPKEVRPAAALSGEENSLVPIIGPHPARPRGTNRLLSHLPLHSQQPGRTPSFLIPIGGIHMVQPRSTLPLYRLVASPAASRIPTGKLAAPQYQDAHKEAVASSAPRRPRAAEQTTAGDKGFPVQQPSTSRSCTERHVYTEGQNSSQKHL